MAHAHDLAHLIQQARRTHPREFSHVFLQQLVVKKLQGCSRYSDGREGLRFHLRHALQKLDDLGRAQLLWMVLIMKQDVPA